MTVQKITKDNIAFQIPSFALLGESHSAAKMREQKNRLSPQGLRNLETIYEETQKYLIRIPDYGYERFNVLDHGRHVYWAIEDEGQKRLLGSLVCVPLVPLQRRHGQKNHCRVIEITVHPQHRRQGVGSALLQQLLESGILMNMQYLSVWRPFHAEAAEGFFQNRGFTQVAREERKEKDFWHRTL